MAFTAELYFPATHMAHESLAALLLPCFPASQSLHVVDADPEYCPTSQLTQLTPTCFFPDVQASHDGDPLVDVFPGTQLVHSDSPAVDSLPASHGLQLGAAVCPTTSPYLPAEHALHWDSAVAPCAELYLPFPHVLHPVVGSDAVVPPSSSRYRPAAQAVHAPLGGSVPYVPLRQSVHAWAAKVENFPLPQLTQVVKSDPLCILPGAHPTHAGCASFVDVLPASHGLHSVAFGSLLYLPGAHASTSEAPSATPPFAM